MDRMRKASADQLGNTGAAGITPQPGLVAYIVAPRRRYAIRVVVVLLVLLLPLRLYRATIEQSLSIDETFSLMVVTHSVPDLIELTQVDQHPPGFYLVLKAWNAVGSAFRIEPSVLWARLPNVFAWITMAVVIGWWTASRPLLVAPFLLAFVICGGCGAADAVRTAGIYGIPFCAISIMCLLLVSEIASRGDLEPRAHTLLRLGGYALCAAAALWVHLLSGIVIAIMGILWAIFCSTSPNVKRRLIRAIATHIAIIVLFLPWLVRMAGQLAAFHSDPRAWTTPASFTNLFRVFTIWYPYGTMGEMTDWVRGWHVALGVASFAFPVTFAFVAIAVTRKRRGAANPLLRNVAIIALCATLCNVLVLWSLTRFGIAQTWHGPRYPMFTSGLWAAGLVALAAYGVHLLQWRPIATMAILAPWLACSVLGQNWGTALERFTGLIHWKAGIPEFPKPGDTVFVMPTELMPYHRTVLKPLSPQPIEKLFDVTTGTKDVAVLNLNPWPGTDTLSNVFLRAVINSSTICERLEQRKIPNNVIGYTLHWLHGYKHEKAAEHRAYGLKPPRPPLPKSAITVALNQDQRLSDGWSAANATTSLYTTRMLRGKKSRLRFSGEIPAGKYTLNFVGQYYAPRGATGQVSLWPDNEAGGYQLPVNAGSISVRVMLDLQHAHAPLEMELRWAPGPVSESSKTNRRRTELHFFFAWLEKA